MGSLRVGSGNGNPLKLMDGCSRNFGDSWSQQKRRFGTRHGMISQLKNMECESNACCFFLVVAGGKTPTIHWPHLLWSLPEVGVARDKLYHKKWWVRNHFCNLITTLINVSHVWIPLLFRSQESMMIDSLTVSFLDRAKASWCKLKPKSWTKAGKRWRSRTCCTCLCKL